MSYTQTTEFYEIPLPQETDLVNPMDDNEAKVRIDTDLHSAKQNASTAVDTANSASDAAAAAVSGLEELSGIVNTEKGKLTALTARVTAAENEIDDVRADGQDAICAYNEPTATSTHDYAIGDYFFYNNVLYRATAAIAIGDTIVPNTNCEARNVTADLIEIKSDLSYKTSTGSGATLSDSLLSLKSVIDGLTDAQKITSIITFGGYTLKWSGNYCFGGVYLNNSEVTNIINVNANTGKAIFVTIATDGTLARVDHGADSTAATLIYAN